MELIHDTRKTSKCAPNDVISRMPENVITNILDRLEIKDAVRTGILSKDWRFKWTMISQLVLCHKLFKRGSEGRIDFSERTINRLLLHLKGAITKFVLYIPNYKKLDVEDVGAWLTFLSEKGIKEFTLINMHRTPLKLPTHLFTCLELKLLKLFNCYFHMPPGFCGFPKLSTLDFDFVGFGRGSIGEFITLCPLLEILKINSTYPIGKVKPNDITQLENLEMLSLPLRDLDIIDITSSDICQLLGFLPKLHELYLDLRMCKLVVEAGGRKKVTIACPRLKTLILRPIFFNNHARLSFALNMIWGIPDLRILNITAEYDDDAPTPSELDYSRVKKLQLRSVVFSSCRGSENEVYLIKLILACSPLLMTIAIHANSSKVFGGENGKLVFAAKLLELVRASSTAKVNIYWS